MSSATPQTIEPRLPVTEEYLPDSDGEPMAETDLHRKIMIDLLHALDGYFSNDPLVYVTGNIFLYYRDDENQMRPVSPDIMVVRGVEKKERRIYKLEEEGKAPDVVIELTSSSRKLEDLGTKRVIYASLGVREYFLFDPYGEYLNPPLRGYRLEDGEYMPVFGNRIRSEILGLELRLEEGQLRLFDPDTNEYLLTPEESEAERLAEKAARQTAEAEIVRLREELAKLRKSQS
ncbi:MAG: Uma2 family endonuclease [bacterium]